MKDLTLPIMILQENLKNGDLTPPIEPPLYGLTAICF
jgi:hypothetical protein